MTTLRRFDTMLDWPPTVRTGAGRVVEMGSPTCCFTSDPPNGTRCSGAGASIVQTGAARSALSPALPLGRFQRPSDRPSFKEQRPVPLAVIFGTGDEDDDPFSLDNPSAICSVCFLQHWRCRCHGGEGAKPL